MIQYKYHPAPSLFCEKWCPQFTKNREQKHTTLLCKTCISLRWHYPNQVSGQDYQVYSQPIYLSSLFSHIISHLFCFVSISSSVYSSISVFVTCLISRGHGDRYSGTLNAVVRFMPSSVNSASACAFKSASIQNTYVCSISSKNNTLHEYLTINLFKEVTCFVKVFQLKMMMPM